MSQTTPENNAAGTARAFTWRGNTIVVRERLVRDREAIRLLVGKLQKVIDADELTFNGLSEFAAIVVLTESGDEKLWTRPSPKASVAELSAALEAWGNFKPSLADTWINAIYADDAEDTTEKN